MWLDLLSEWISKRRGLPTMLAILLVVINFILQFFPGLGWLATSNLFLHLGIIIGLMSLLLSAALGG